jgi:RND family efflux transporter MFP subunit
VDQRVDKRDALDALRRRPDEDSAPPSRTWLKWVLSLTVVLLLAAGGGALWWMLQPKPVLVHATEVTVEGGPQGAVLNASGYVVPQLQATVAAQVTGMVTEVYVREGETVAKDQVIARLDDRAARAAAEAAAGQLKAGEASVLQYQALVDRDAQDLRRKRMLAREGAVSQATLEEAEASLKQNQALVAYSQGMVEQYRNTLAYNNTQLAYTEIRAPFPGVVTERYAHPGEMISPQAVGGFTQTGICTIVDMSSLEVDVDVNETFITRLHAGQTASVVLDAYPDWRIAARVITIVPTANQQKATVKVRVGFAKLDPRILPQMSAQVWFEGEGGGAAPVSMSIPRAAVHGEAGRTTVFRLENGAVRQVSIRLGGGLGDQVRVLSGLREGDRVVTSSDEPLTDGQKVRES